MVTVLCCIQSSSIEGFGEGMARANRLLGLTAVLVFAIFISFLYFYFPIKNGGTSLRRLERAEPVGDLHVNRMGKKQRLLCWILTGVPNHMKRAIHTKRTWGSHCDILLFMSSQNGSPQMLTFTKNIRDINLPTNLQMKMNAWALLLWLGRKKATKICGQRR